MPAWTLGVGAHLQVFSSQAGAFGGSDAVVVEITTPATVGNNLFGSISWAEWGGAPTPRVVAVSSSPCDFNGMGNNSTAHDLATGTLYFSIGPNSYGWPAFSQPNTKYYVNFMNTSCASGNCAMMVEFVPPK
jgi:hypothetical protein